ncbi:MAG: hypothetical protein ACFFCV_09580 [Promethearchaeota archaeon]
MGDFIADQINISAPAARGLLKLAIKDKLGPFKSINEIDFIEFKSVIKDTLKQRLIQLDVPDNEDLIDFLLIQLTKKQSLITLSKI